MIRTSCVSTYKVPWLLHWYTHKTSGFKTSETSGLQNVRFTKRQVYKTSGRQNVRSSKRLVAKKHPYTVYSVLVVGGNPQGSVAAMFAGKKLWLCFILYFRGFFCHISP
jgi:hypothetical protein